MRYPFLSLFFCCITYSGLAQVTFASDIAEIIYQKCATCHRTGEIGPVAFTNYEEVKAWGTMIEYVTNNKIMPPWQADAEYSNFLGENFLSNDEIAAISTWVSNGMPRGNVQEEPEFPDFPSGSVLGEPDLVLEMDEVWLHEGNYQDDYRYFVLPTNLPEDKIIKAVEFRPGNSKIVHHALLFEDVTGAAAANDAQTPEYGFDGFGSFNGGGPAEILSQKQFPGYTPGQKPIRFPDGVGQVLHAGADVVVQIHYAPWPVDETDQSKVNIFFMDESDETLERELQGHIMVPFFNVINDLFFIPANTERTFHGTYEVPIDVSLVNIAPHMHLLGQHWEVWLERPDGEIVNLVRIPEWDFNWQGEYYFDRYIVAPAGSIIHAVASYDNTTNNPNNPNNPPQSVSWGDKTTDEMYYLPIGYVEYQEGDEDIVFNDPTVSTAELASDGSRIYPLQPNPVENFTVAGFHLEKGQPLNITIYDLAGNLVRTLRKAEFFNIGEHFVNFSTRNLASGIYILQISGNNLLMNQKFVKP
ncbi:MAG: T9SS type A sorting domain-containing protein [Bacteroidota bacterium]